MSKVLVLLATLNGQRFLEEQLSSLAGQSWPQIDLAISDDGSTDDTLNLIEEFSTKWTKGVVRILSGPRSGRPADNFRSLIVRSDDQSDYFAFCDQDDVWLSNKLAAAISELHELDANIPALHCSRTKLIDDSGRPVGESTYFSRPPHFRNALVQALAGGNTMVMNRAAFQLVKRSCERTDFVVHDWWTYMIVSGAGGTIVYKPTADTFYRQHSANNFGSNQNWIVRWRRLRSLLGGQWKVWNDLNESSLLACRDLLSPQGRRDLEMFRSARRGTPWGRVQRLVRARVYRQTPVGQIALYVAALFDLI